MINSEDINLKDLINAIKKNNVHFFSEERRSAIKPLLQNIFEVKTSDGVKSNTPLIYAIRLGQIAIVEKLIQWGEDVNQALPTTGVTPLIIAAQEDHLDIINLLIHHKAEIDEAQNVFGVTALYMAAQSNHIEIAKLLIENKANVNHADKNGVSPLFIAAQNDCSEVIKYLIISKSDVNQACTDNGATPLFAATEQGHFHTVKLLIQNKSDVNHKNNNGVNALFMAVQQDDFDCVIFLIKNNSEINQICSKKDVTPLDVAVANGNVDITRILLDNHFKINTLPNNPILVARYCKQPLTRDTLIAHLLRSKDYNEQQMYDLLQAVPHKIIHNCQNKVKAANQETQNILLLFSDKLHADILYQIVMYNHGIYTPGISQFLQLYDSISNVLNKRKQFLPALFAQKKQNAVATSREHKQDLAVTKIKYP